MENYKNILEDYLKSVNKDNIFDDFEKRVIQVVATTNSILIKNGFKLVLVNNKHNNFYYVTQIFLVPLSEKINPLENSYLLIEEFPSKGLASIETDKYSDSRRELITPYEITNDMIEQYLLKLITDNIK